MDGPTAFRSDHGEVAGQDLDLSATRHESLELLEADLTPSVRADGSTPVENGERVADGVGVPRIVRDEDHRGLLAANVVDAVQNHRCLTDAKRRRRFVEDQHPGR
jgi:hypothetical protein